MLEPKPESRIKSLENRASTIEATILELASDTSEELKAIRQEIKQGHLDIGTAIDTHGNALMQEIHTRFDSADQRLTAIEGRLDTMATKDDIARLEGLIKQLLPKPPES